MVRLIPGDPAVEILGQEATPELIALTRAELGIDKPFLDQFVSYVQNFFRGEFGTSFFTKQPVSALISQRLGPSVQLAAISLAVVLLVSVPLGLLAAHFTREGRHPKIEVLWASLTGMLGSIPVFLKATLLVFIFAYWLRLLPVAGREGWESLVLPVAALTIAPVLSLARIVRLQTLDALTQDYVRTAKGKRLDLLTIYFRHVMPNVVTVVLTVGGMVFSGLIAGTIFVEQIFVRLGMGTALIGGVRGHDYPVVQAIVLLLGIAVVVVNTIVDILIGMVDPRSLTTQT